MQEEKVPQDVVGARLKQRDPVVTEYYSRPTAGLLADAAGALVTGGPGGPVRLRVEDRSNGLPALPGFVIAPRPSATMPAPFELADPTVVTRTVLVGG